MSYKLFIINKGKKTRLFSKIGVKIQIKWCIKNGVKNTKKIV